jgi:phasin family protein
MIVEMKDYVAERGELLRGQVRKLRDTSVDSVREAVTGSAETIKSLKSPVRVIARSGVKLSTVSQEAVQNLIELQSDIVTSALTDVALRLERATKAENLVELVREQIELTPATRARVVEDAGRAVTIVKTAGRDLRNVAVHAFETLYEKGKGEVEAKPVRRKAKRATRKTSARPRKAAQVAA